MTLIGLTVFAEADRGALLRIAVGGTHYHLLPLNQVEAETLAAKLLRCAHPDPDPLKPSGVAGLLHRLAEPMT